MIADFPRPSIDRWQEIKDGLAREPFYAPKWLRGGHIQTIWAHAFRRESSQNRERFDVHTDDGETMPVHHVGVRPGVPALVIAHGIEGNAHARYVHGLTQEAELYGLGALAFSLPGCEAPLGRARRLYHSGDTDDLLAVLRAIATRFPTTPLWVVGISMGGNIAGLAFGRHCDELPRQVIGGVAISPPYDLTASARQVDRTLNGVYVRRFLRGLKPKAIAKHAQFPGAFDLQAALAAQTFEAFDGAVTAPLHGFRDALDYWERSSSGPWLSRVDRPFLLLSAVDDPFHPPHTLPREAVRDQPWLAAAFPEHGGHVAFRGGPAMRPTYWAERQAVRVIAMASLEGLQASTRNEG